VTIVLALLALNFANACAKAGTPEACSLDVHAREYVELVAALAVRDPKSIDMPVAPPQRRRTSGEIRLASSDLIRHLRSMHQADGDAARRQTLLAQLTALGARAEQVGGARLSFNDERQRLFGLSASGRDSKGHGRAALARLDRLVPGRGSLGARLAAYQQRFVVPFDKLPAVMTSALGACRDATAHHLVLPAGESLTIAYTDSGSWSGYSRYQGQFHSTMQINRQFALPVDRVLTLACHEGYPGHHVMSSLRDQHLARGRGWIETSVAPLFSPESYAMEALASAAPGLLFTEAQRAAIERERLFPLAGFDPSEAGQYVHISQLVESLDGAVLAITERYLTGQLDIFAAGEALRTDAAMAEPAATLRFIDDYRFYSTAYTGGRMQATSALGPPSEPVEDRWRRFVAMTLAGSLDADGTTE
jgi:hypothetical protein